MAPEGVVIVMNKNLRWKVITIVAVLVIFAGVGVYPIVASYYGCRSAAWLMNKQLKLGLDLKGGVHLVLRVQTDDALQRRDRHDMRAAARGAADRDIPVDRTSRRRSDAVQASKACRRRRTRRSARRADRARSRTSIAAPAPAAPTRSR